MRIIVKYIQIILNIDEMADNDLLDDVLLLWTLYQTSRAEEAQELHEDWYTVEEIAEEMDMDEDLVDEIVWWDDY